jgi:hypothetical protein
MLSLNVPLGFGKHVPDVDPTNFSQLGFQSLVGGTFAIASVIMSKTSFGITLLRFTEGKTRWFILFVVISMNIVTWPSALFLWIQCDPVAKGWNQTLPGTCWNPRVNVVYGIITGVYSGLADWALALLPWKVIWGLQMARKEKIGVGVAMSMGML